MRLRRAVAAAAPSGAGRVLAALTSLVAAARPAAKPLHPRGELVRGAITRSGDGPHSGVDWVDTPGHDAVVARSSRAVGLPAPLPDILGMAVRVRLGPDRTADLLFATTGLGRLTRYLLAPARDLTTSPATTLLPYRSPTGPLSFAITPAGPRRFRLMWARPDSGWHPFGWLVLEPGPGTDPGVSFDPTASTLPGLSHYAWVVRLRAPAYAAARRSRR